MDNPLSLNRYTYVSNNPLRYIDPSGHKGLEFAEGSHERINSDGLSFEDASLYWAKKTVEYADATGAASPYDVVEEVVPAEYVEEVKTIVGMVGAPKWQREYGDVPDLGMAAPATVAVVGSIKNTAKAPIAPTKEINMPTKNNYRKLYTDANPGMPSNYQVHHTLPQKYEGTMKNAGINIHETQYLRGVDPSIHSKITTAWTKWDKSLGRTPTAQDVQNFAKDIDKQYGQYWYKP